MFESLKFWKKKDDFASLGSETDFGKTDANPFPSTPSQFPSTPSSSFDSPYSPNSFSDKTSFEGTISRRDIDLLSSKLDTIKAMLENVMQRIDRLEKENPSSFQGQNPQGSFQTKYEQQKRWY
jgi:hypothetical protein